ncbi:MlaD family protein [Lichenicoccus sp.]|uniref:MlaD family protein n=1 Tax=Lichenicoccus sp. TaxID=2781899 RepID=UPI003D0B5B11
MARHSGFAVLASASVIAVTGGFCAYTVLQRHQAGGPRYGLEAIFTSANGLQAGADVRIGGVTVGRVASITLDPATFVTKVAFRIDDRYRLPADTSLSIGSSGFTAADALLVEPGHAGRRLAPGATIRDTHAMLSLEQSISQYIFGGGGLGD